jgi:hypothetical protein
MPQLMGGAVERRDGNAAAVRRLAGIRADVDLGEYALPAILERYERVYERTGG